MSDILQVLRQLRPGTSWAQMRDGTIFQVEDGVPQVEFPTEKEIQQYIDAHPEPVIKSIEQRLLALEDKVSKIPTVDVGP